MKNYVQTMTKQNYSVFIGKSYRYQSQKEPKIYEYLFSFTDNQGNVNIIEIYILLHENIVGEIF